MKKLIVYSISFFLLLFITTGIAEAGTRLMYVDFEQGASWDYNDYFLDIGSNGDKWTVTSSNPYSGTYCVESEAPGPAGGEDDSLMWFNAWGSWGSELFLRYKAKYPTDWVAEATDSNGGANHMRFYAGGTSKAEYVLTSAGSGSNGWLHIYTDFIKYPANMILRDNQWHELAFYIKMPSRAGASDGIFRAWRDGNGTYTTANALIDYANFSTDQPWTRTYIGCYYKMNGVPSGNWRWWYDNIEIWDGMPTAEEPTKSISGCGLSGCSIGGD